MKKCLNCGAIYHDDSMNFCDCGGYLQLIQEDSSQDKEINVQPNDKETFQEPLAVSKMEESTAPEPICEKIRIQVYHLKNKIFDKVFYYDEIIIGRSKTNADVDINLRDFDEKHQISRKHLKILKDNNKYYLSLLSDKATVKLNDIEVKQDQQQELHNNDRIILSKEIGIRVLKV